MSNSHIEMCGLAGDTEKLLEEAVDEDGVSLLGLGEMDDDEENDLKNESKE